MPVSALNAVQAGQRVFGQAQKINSRITPPIEDYKFNEMEQEVHVFSVCKWDHPVPMGTWGTFIIPGKKDDQEYAELKAVFPFYKDAPTSVPGLMMIPRNMDGVENVWHEESGREFANKLITEYMRFGVFVAAGDKPTKAELEEANTRWKTMCGYFVEQARELSADPFKRREIQIRPHHEAAAVLGLDEPWTKAESAKTTQKCPQCGKTSEIGVLICANHDPAHVFDIPAYIAYKKQQDALFADAQKGGK